MYQHILPLSERNTYALPINSRCLIIDGQVCFDRRQIADAVKPYVQECIFQPWGVFNCMGYTILLLMAVLSHPVFALVHVKH